jgi:hypothetical protein
MDQSKYKGLIVTIIILLMVIVFQYFTFNNNQSDFKSKIDILHHKNDSLLLEINKNELKIQKMDSLVNIYQSRIDSNKSELADLQIVADENEKKYNEERNRLIIISNKSVVREFTNAFKG